MRKSKVFFAFIVFLAVSCSCEKYEAATDCMDSEGVIDSLAEIFDGKDDSYYEPMDHVIRIYEDYSTEDVYDAVIVADGKLVGKLADGDVTYSADETKCIYEIYDGTLYYITADEIILLSENASKAKISFDGSGVAYNVDSELFLYDADKNETYSIDTIMEDTYLYGFAISSDGDTVVYVSDDVEMYTYKDGKYVHYAIIGSPIGVSNSSKQILTREYYYKEVYVINEISLGGQHGIPDVDYGESCLMGGDSEYPQTFITTEYDDPWLCLNGTELIELEGLYSYSPLIPPQTVMTDMSVFTDKLYISNYVTGNSYVAYVDEQGGVADLFSTIEQYSSDESPKLSKDGESIYFLAKKYDNSMLCRFRISDILDGTTEDIESISLKELDEDKYITPWLPGDITDWFVNEENGKVYVVCDRAIWYLNEYNAWRYMYEDFIAVAMTYDGTFYCVSNDHILYSSEDGEEFVIVAEDVYDVECVGNDVYYWSNEKEVAGKPETYTIYGKDNDGGFNVIISNGDKEERHEYDYHVKLGGLNYNQQLYLIMDLGTTSKKDIIYEVVRSIGNKDNGYYDVYIRFLGNIEECMRIFEEKYLPEISAYGDKGSYFTIDRTPIS